MQRILEGRKWGFFLEKKVSVIPRGLNKEGNGTLHSSQASDLLGRNGWLRILQDAPEMSVADLTLPFEEKTKRESVMSEFCDWAKKMKIYTFGRSSTSSFE